MNTVSIHDAKTNLSKYIAAAKKGESVYIGGFGKAEVVLTRLQVNESSLGQRRTFSLGKGKVTEKQNSFSLETDQDIARLMYG